MAPAISNSTASCEKSVKKIKALPIQKILPAHHELNIPMGLIDAVDKGFTEIYEAGKLQQGNGIFQFRDFQIHI